MYCRSRRWMGVYIIFSAECLEYGERGHPESPERVYSTARLLMEKGLKFVEPKPCEDEDILLVHTREFVEDVKRGKLNDPDTPNIPRIYHYAKLSAGGAIKAMELALEGEAAFSLMRPPGHHAGRNGRALNAPSLGFCYFNNIAIACAKAMKQCEVGRVAVIDIDCHHGNGTQEIFLNNPGVLFISLHKFGFFYPGTGATSEGNCLNYPLGWNTTEPEYMAALRSALKEVERFNPDLVAVSAGFDTYKVDPIGGLGLSKESYKTIGRMISELGKRTFAVLEGGYSRDMPECVYNLLVGLENF